MRQTGKRSGRGASGKERRRGGLPEGGDPARELDFLTGKLREQYGPEGSARVLDGYRRERPVTLRVNTLKTDTEAVIRRLSREDISCRRVPWWGEVLIVEGVREPALQRLDLYERGEIYLQSLSSMLPPLILDPQAGESILDMAAAPGGKTTQIAAMTGNGASVTACERDRIRGERLRYNLDRQGASRVLVMIEDARKLDDLFSFDRILLDAPCSGSGTVRLASDVADGGDGTGIAARSSRNRFSGELLARSARLQEELLRKAVGLLKPGHEMVYSTCSILKEENEQVLEKILSEGKTELVPIRGEWLRGLPLLPGSIPGTLTVCPDELYEGFFVAKLRKKE